MRLLKVVSKKYNDKDVLEVENFDTAVNQSATASGFSKLKLFPIKTSNGELTVTVEGIIYDAYFNFKYTEEELNSLPSAGLMIIMFNTTCVIIPYSKTQDNRFVCNMITTNGGGTSLARAKVSFVQEEGFNAIFIHFDEITANTLYNNAEVRPYAILRVIDLGE